MSRTHRCKNYVAENNSSWDRQGWKTNREYTTQVDYWANRMARPVDIDFRPMDKEERRFCLRKMHGESRSANQRTPGSWFRKNRMKENRMINKRELHRWFQYGGEYDPCFESEPRSHWWDWS